MSTQFYFPPFNSSLAYSKYDVVYGITNIDGTFPTAYFYATQDLTPNMGSPSGFYTFGLTSYSRTDDVTTITFPQTGAAPIAPGSIIRVAGATINTSIEYTGMVIGGGSGWASYLNPGWPAGVTQMGNTGTVSMLNPGWTTGFLFIPAYTTKMTSQNKTITAKMGDSYEQREAAGLNAYDKDYQLAFQSRGNRETRAIVNYVQDAGGVRCFPILIPVSFLENQPNHQYVSPDVTYSTDSYGLNTINVTVRRVFDL